MQEEDFRSKGIGDGDIVLIIHDTMQNQGPRKLRVGIYKHETEEGSKDPYFSIHPGTRFEIPLRLIETGSAGGIRYDRVHYVEKLKSGAEILNVVHESVR